MRHPFLVALFITVLLFTGYFAWRSSATMQPPAETVAPPARTVPATPAAPAVMQKSVPELITMAQQQIDDGDYDHALVTLGQAKQKDPANQQVAKLIARATSAKETEERIQKRRQ